MSKRWILIALMGFGLVAVSAATLQAKGKAKNNGKENDQQGQVDQKDENKDEVKVTIDQVPAAVKATLEKETAGGTIKEISKDTEDGKTVYEADVTIDGKDLEIKIAEDGTLISKKADENKDEGDKGDKNNEKDQQGVHEDKD